MSNSVCVPHQKPHGVGHHALSAAVARFEAALAELIDAHGIELDELDWRVLCYICERRKWETSAKNGLENTIAKLREKIGVCEATASHRWPGKTEALT